MKCIDCKFCAFINEDDQEMIVKSNGSKMPWVSVKGAYCMKTTCTMTDVTECSVYEKSKHKKLKAL